MSGYRSSVFLRSLIYMPFSFSDIRVVGVSEDLKLHKTKLVLYEVIINFILAVFGFL